MQVPIRCLQQCSVISHNPQLPQVKFSLRGIFYLPRIGRSIFLPFVRGKKNFSHTSRLFSVCAKKKSLSFCFFPPMNQHGAANKLIVQKNTQIFLSFREFGALIWAFQCLNPIKLDNFRHGKTSKSRKYYSIELKIDKIWVCSG